MDPDLSETNNSTFLVVPGQTIATNQIGDNGVGGEDEADDVGGGGANSTTFLRGHGTYLEYDPETGEERLIAAVAGLVERVNKLISVVPVLASQRYIPHVGDLVVGRIVSVAATRWKVQLTTSSEGQLPLSGVHLPGGVQRMRTAQDARDMRLLFQEGDLVSAEVHKVLSQDSTAQLHTRSLRYGKLENGCLIVVPPVLIQRRKIHFVDFVDQSSSTADIRLTLLMGTNGYIWIQRSLQQSATTTSNVIDQGGGGGSAAAAAAAGLLATQHEELQTQHAKTPVLREERRAMARVRNSIDILRRIHWMVTPENIEQVYHASKSYSAVPSHDNIAAMLQPKTILQLTEIVRNQQRQGTRGARR